MIFYDDIEISNNVSACNCDSQCYDSECSGHCVNCDN